MIWAKRFVFTISVWMPAIGKFRRGRSVFVFFINQLKDKPGKMSGVTTDVWTDDPLLMPERAELLSVEPGAVQKLINALGYHVSDR